MSPVRSRSGKPRLRKARVAAFVLPIVAVLSTMGFAFASQLDMSGPTPRRSCWFRNALLATPR